MATPSIREIVDAKLRDAVEERLSIHSYPLHDKPTACELANLGVGVGYRLAAIWTGEERPPTTGEWFLAGERAVRAYRAAYDMSRIYLIARSRIYLIARLVRVTAR